MHVKAFRTTAQCRAVAPSRFTACISAPFCICSANVVSTSAHPPRDLQKVHTAIHSARDIPLTNIEARADDCSTRPSATEGVPARKVTQ